MRTRRDVMRSLLALGAVSASYPLVPGCGARATDAGGSLLAADVSRGPGDAGAQAEAVQAVQALTADLYRRVAAEPGNVVCSPYSVAVALAMTRNGARGETATEMDDVLSAPPLDRFNTGLNALTRLIDSRAGRQRRADGSRATISLDVANSLWGQHDTAWEPAFLDALARHYGAGMRLVDDQADSESARALINQWTAAKTHDRIPEIVPPGVLDALTRLVLVNAIFLKAPWAEPFEVASTEPGAFIRADGSRVETQMMHATLESASYARGPGWQAARLPYAGEQLAMTIVVPDQSDLADLERSLTGPELTRALTTSRPVGPLRLTMPRWEFRLASSLNEHLIDLGMPTAFDDVRADFSGMTTEERLSISAVLHEAFIAVDEKGTEAAAATVVVMRAESAPANPVAPVVLDADRAFLFVVHDVDTATPLFIGRVDDPNAAA